MIILKYILTIVFALVSIYVLDGLCEDLASLRRIIENSGYRNSLVADFVILVLVDIGMACLIGLLILIIW